MMQSKEVLKHSFKIKATFCLLVRMYQMTILFVLKGYFTSQIFNNTGKDYLWIQNYGKKLYRLCGTDFCAYQNV